MTTPRASRSLATALLVRGAACCPLLLGGARRRSRRRRGCSRRRRSLPARLVLDHYRALFAERDFWMPIRNSLIVAGATTVAGGRARRVLRLRAGAAALSRQGAVLAFVLAVSMFPQISIVSPLYLLLRELHCSTPIPDWSCRI